MHGQRTIVCNEKYKEAIYQWLEKERTNWDRKTYTTDIQPSIDYQNALLLWN